MSFFFGWTAYLPFILRANGRYQLSFLLPFSDDFSQEQSITSSDDKTEQLGGSVVTSTMPQINVENILS